MRAKILIPEGSLVKRSYREIKICGDFDQSMAEFLELSGDFVCLLMMIFLGRMQYSHVFCTVYSPAKGAQVGSRM